MNNRLPLTFSAAFVFFWNVGAYAEVGRTVGQFTVGPTGDGQYTIPIFAPPGPRGIQPNISLFYDSRSPIGPLGMGWSIAGLGQITRCNKTVAQDTTAAPVALQVSDGYCINGSRLRLVSGTYGEANSIYQTEIADFSQITAVGTTGNGPEYFKVQGRNGLTYYYGYNTYGQNSQVIAAGSSPQTALTWLLCKVVDRSANGNNYIINYTTLSGQLIGTAVPSTIYWTSTGSGYAYTMQFNYGENGPNVPQSSPNKYQAGTNVFNPQLLSSIEILYDTTVVKDYALTYTQSTTTGREQLTKVTECQTAGTNCLSPTTITYSQPPAGVSSSATTALSSTGTKLSARYDLNGDGIPDLIYNNGTDWYVAFGSTSGFQAPINTTIPASATVLPGNLNAGPEDGLLVSSSTVWKYYTWNGTTFSSTSTNLTYDSTATQYQLADVNGDGLPDLISLYLTGSSGNYTASVDFRLNGSSGSTISFGSLSTGYTLGGGLGSAQLNSPDTQYGKLRRYDFNGDGLDDLVLTTEVPSGHTDIVRTYELITQGSVFNAFQIAQGGGGYPPAFFTNWNDDACTDYVFVNTLYISGCNGTVPTTVALSGTVVSALDWDGDGRTDLLVATGATGTDLEVYQSTGGISPIIQSTSVVYNSSCQYVTMNATGGGFDDLGCWILSGSLSYYLHNGAPDLVTEIEDGYGNFVKPSFVSIAKGSYTQSSTATYPDQNYIGPLYVVSGATFSDPSGSALTYSQTYSYYNAWVNAQGRGFDGFGLVGTYDSRNALTDFKYYEQVFPYTGMVYQDILSNGSMYATRQTNTPVKLTLSSASNEQRYFPYFSPMYEYQWEFGGAEAGDMITEISSNYNYDSYGNVISLVKTTTDVDPGSPYNGDSWTTTTNNTIDIDQSGNSDAEYWCLTMLDETQNTYSSTINGSNTITRTQQFIPDVPQNCRNLKIIIEPSSSLYKVTETLTYDTTYGNIIVDSLTGASVTAPTPGTRTTNYGWSTYGQFLTSMTDPTGAQTKWSFTSNQAFTFGVPDTMTDPNSTSTYPIISSWLYDNFGRRTSEVRPDGTSTTWTWSACSSNCGTAVYQVARALLPKTGSTIRTDTNLYDPVDRIVQASGPTVAGTIATIQTNYWPLGMLYKQSLPYLAGGTEYWQSYDYDVLNRLTEIERPVKAGGSQTFCNPTQPPVSGCQGLSYAYAGRKLTVIDAKGNPKTTIIDVNGWLRKTTDAIGTGYTVTRAYDAAGSLTGITDSVGNTLLSNVMINYGLSSYIVAGTDADLGAFTNTYDSFGERSAWTDNNFHSFSMSYDALSRPTSRTDMGDLYSEWNYGTAVPNFGHLMAECSETSSSANFCATGSWLYNENRGYDTLGRLTTRTITQNGNPGNDGGGAFKFTVSYDPASGFLSTLTYPTPATGTPLGIQYGYQNGLLHTVTDTTDTTATCGTTCTLWTASAMDGFGHITQESFGSGVSTTRTYEAVTSWLTKATGGLSGGSGLLNQSYLQDADGNVTQRQDGVHSLTESFGYDADNRLVCTALSASCSTNNFQYDDGSAGPGNITMQTGVGTYNYNPPGQGSPHQLRSITGTFNGITNPSFSYDGNGNMTARASTTTNIIWSSYNYPTSISASDTAGTEQVAYTYGPDRQRTEQVTTNQYGTEMAYYVGSGFTSAPGQLEVAFLNGSPNYRHYIYAGSEPVAVYSRTSAASTMSYLLGDHQGSVSAITSNGGALNVGESFTAFGQHREPTTWSGAPSQAEFLEVASFTRQGYTFQTWLGQSMGLNHMNGRVEDAILGRFISADPYIPNPSYGQSYNRYSYVNNNPLTLIDPYGFKKKTPGGGDDDDDDDDDSGTGGSGSGNGNGWGTPDNGCTDVPLQCTGTAKKPPSVPNSPVLPPTPDLGAGGGGQKPRSAASAIKNFLCPNDGSNVQQIADTLSNAGTAADLGSPALGNLGQYAAQGRTAQAEGGAVLTKLLQSGPVQVFGRIGQAASGVAAFNDYLSGNYAAAFIYDPIDFFVYDGLATFGAVSAAPTLGGSVAVAGGTGLLYNNAGGAKGLIQGAICP
jgi:RHS repeat-associated protein